MIDPMLATGGSAVAALDLLRRANARAVRIVCIVAAPEGIALVEQHQPGRPHLYARRRPRPERAQVHRAGAWRFRRSALRHGLTRKRGYGPFYERWHTAPRKRTRIAARTRGRRAIAADGAHRDRAEQDPDPRLPTGRDDGASLVCGGGVSAPDGRAADAGDRAHVQRDSGVLARSWRHAAVHARGQERRDIRCADEGQRRGGRARVWPAPRRRTSKRACGFWTPASRWCAAGAAIKTPRRRSWMSA